MTETTEILNDETGPDTEVGMALRKKDLVDRIAARTQVKRGDVKTVAEATFEVLGDAIAAGEEMNLPGLGRVKLVRQKDTPNAIIYTVRMRQPLADAEPLAKPVDNG